MTYRIRPWPAALDALHLRSTINMHLHLHIPVCYKINVTSDDMTEKHCSLIESSDG